MNELIIRELKAILENLCGTELRESGREYIRNRIKYYEVRIFEAAARNGDRDDNTESLL